MSLKISVITSFYNAERYIYETIESVLNQSAVISGRVQLEYILKDACSTDRSVSIVNKFSHPAIKLISTPDRGLYHGLSQGFSHVSGDIVAYLNAGDYYNKFAFDVVVDCFENSSISWLTGARVLYNDKSQISSYVCPVPYRSRLIEVGAYGLYMPYIQQESTFWRRDLMRDLNFDVLSGFRLAGDFYMWSAFAKRASLYIVNSHLGGFRIHDGQLSSELDKYIAEINSIRKKETLVDRLVILMDSLFYLIPFEYRPKFVRRNTFSYDHKAKIWRDHG